MIKKPNKDLTKIQKNILYFIKDFSHKNSMSPTYVDIASNFGYKSNSTVETHLIALEKKGAIKRIAGKARGIIVSDAFNSKKHLIPLVGTVAAGQPILAEENIVEYLDLYKIFYTDSEIFALNVKGDSMINAGIMDGDMVVVKKQPVLENGEIGVVIIDDEATVKRVFFKGKSLVLQPENNHMQKMVVSADQHNVLIAGKVIGVIRKDIK